MADDTIEEIREQKIAELVESSEISDKTGTPSEPVYIDDAADFEKVVNQHDVALVDFYADWCGPCQMIAPVLEELALDTAATIVKIDVENHQRLASKYNVRGVPTLILFVDGDPEERLVGVHQKPRLMDLIEQYS